MSNRNVIIEDIRASLERDPRIAHAATVAVAEREGRVTLRGTVRSMHQRRTAVEIARSARGVRAVEDGLRIDPRDHARDDEIRGAALQALSDDGASGWGRRGRRERLGDPQGRGHAPAGAAMPRSRPRPRSPAWAGITNRITVVSPGGDR